MRTLLDRVTDSETVSMRVFRMILNKRYSYLVF